MRTAQVHRWINCVAIRVGDRDTVYIAPNEAFDLATALIQCAIDCKTTEATYPCSFKPIEIGEEIT